jgi:hypothetical protein
MARLSLRSLLLGVCVLLGLWVAPTAADARKSGSRPPAIRLTFSRVEGATAGLLPSTDGRYVAIQQADGVLVTNQHTGQSTVQTTAAQGGSCHTSATEFAGPWLVGTCITASENYVAQLYSPATGAWRTISLPENCVWDGGSGYSGASECAVGPAGADWMAWTETCWNCGSYGGLIPLSPGDGPIDQILSTTPRTVTDYDSPTLIARLCAPLRDTPTNRLIVNSSGQFVADAAPLGRFALAYGRHHAVFLERCGSHIRRRLASYPITGNASELLFDSNNPATLTGIFLPNLRKFVIHIPRALLSPNPGPQREVLYASRLSSNTLYIVGPGGELWATAAPNAKASKR